MLETDRYLPVPVWNAPSATWEPVDYRKGQILVTWPTSVDLTRLPHPAYQEGDHIQFVRDEPCAREGVVRLVRLAGGSYGPFEQVEEVIRQRYYSADHLFYVVTARGHDHLMREANILGCFVSYWRSSCEEGPQPDVWFQHELSMSVPTNGCMAEDVGRQKGRRKGVHLVQEEILAYLPSSLLSDEPHG